MFVAFHCVDVDGEERLFNLAFLIKFERGDPQKDEHGEKKEVVNITFQEGTDTCTYEIFSSFDVLKAQLMGQITLARPGRA